jgi:hypothetical protein
MSRLLLLGIALLLAAPAHAQTPADTSAVVGTWQGALSIGQDSLRIVFEIERSADSLAATMDSPDQGATGIPVPNVLVTADTLRLGVPSIAGAFAGVLKEQGARTVVDGQWVQGPTRLPLTLRKTDAAPEVRRPQTPEPPFPYRADSVSFRNDDIDIALAGTLTRPAEEAADGPVPAVVIVGGSGPQDRNGTIQGHEPFHVLADHLTRQGIAVLRYDERGVGASEGTLRGATSRDLAGDVQAAVAFLAEQSGIDASRVGIIGHSEGGMIAPMVATETDQVGFLVLLAAPGLPGREVLADQLEDIGRSRGVDSRALAVQRGTQQRIFEALTQEADSADIATELKQIMRDTQGISGEEAIEQQVQQLTSPWFRFFVSYDPRPALRQIEVPVLALTGSNDLQVAADTNLAAIEDALESGQNPPHTVRVVDGLNHLLQPSETGAVSDYGRIETTLAPRVLEEIAAWIRDQSPER